MNENDRYTDPKDNGQRPMAPEELEGFVEFFRFRDFAGYVWERPNV